MVATVMFISDFISFLGLSWLARPGALPGHKEPQATEGLPGQGGKDLFHFPEHSWGVWDVLG